MTTYTASNSTELYDALAKCNGGETILLEGGNYGDLKLNAQTNFKFDYPSTVTIASKDPDDPAVFTGANVSRAENLTIDGVKFDYTFAQGDGLAERQFSFTGCENLTIRNSEFDGDLAQGVNSAADGYAYGLGLSVRFSTGVVIENNELSEFYKGLSVDECTDVVVRGNELHSMRMDGMNFSQVDTVLVEDNYVHDFHGSPNSGDHCDFIQFWTEGDTASSRNITIRGNVLDIGEGTTTQSIFMRNEMVDTGRAGSEMFYQNVLIEDNTITNAHKHGINLGEAAGVTIRNNSVLHVDGSKPDGTDGTLEIPLITVAGRSTDVTIVSNVTKDVLGHDGQAGWVVAGNILVQDQDPLKANFYSDIFVASTLQPTDGKHEFVVLPGSIVDESGAGSSRTHATLAGLNPIFHVEQSDVATMVFDASTASLNGQVLPAGTTYTWTFGDGSTAKGATVSHSFAECGVYEAELTIRLPNGRVASETMTVKVQDATVLSLSEEGHFVVYHDGVEIDRAALSKYTASGLQLGANGTTASVSRTDVLDVVGADDMSIAFTLEADTAGASGEVFRLQGSFSCSVTSSGELQFRLYQQNGSEVRITTNGAGLNTGTEKDVVVLLADDKLQAWVDGDMLAETSATGVVGGATGFNSHNLVFGNPWNGTNFNGDLSAFEISVGAGDFPAKPETEVVSSTPRALYSTTAVMEKVVQDVELLRLDPDGHFVAYQDGQTTNLSDLSKHSDAGLQLGANGVSASVSRSHVNDVIGAEDMSITFTLGADTAGASGEVFRLHGSFTCSITSSGEVQFRLNNQEGVGTNFTTKGANIANGDDHDIAVQFADNKLKIWVDGAKLAEGAAPGVVGGATGFGTHDLVFGNPWNKANFNGDLSAFEVSIGAEDGEGLAVAAPGELTTVDAMEDLIEVTSSADEWSDRFEFMNGADLSAIAA